MKKARWIGPGTKTVQSMQEIQAVIDSCHDAVADNPYTVILPPGTWNEQVVMKNHVNLKGVGRGSTILEHVDNTVIMDNITESVEISDLTIRNLSDTNKSVYFGGDYSGVTNIRNCQVEKLSTNPFGTLALSFENVDGVVNCYGSNIHGIETLCGQFGGQYNLYSCDIYSQNGTPLWSSGRLTSRGRVFNSYIHSDTVGDCVGVFVGEMGGNASILRMYNSHVYIKSGSGNVTGLETVMYGKLYFYGGSVITESLGQTMDIKQEMLSTLEVYDTKYSSWTGSRLAGNSNIPGKLNVGTTTHYTNNTAALAGGLVAGDFYRTTDVLKVVH